MWPVRSGTLGDQRDTFCSNMTEHKALGDWDYVVIILTMVISVAVGFYFRFTGTRQKTTSDFLMAGRSMGRFPVIFSLVVTKLSAIAIIGEPADIYLYGTQRCIGFVFIFIGCAVTAYVFLPVYFAVGASTIYEYLERRFGRKTRRTISFLGYIQTLLNMSVVIYTPAIAMSAVTEITTESSLILIGAVCILFSALGGLKAVMWADVFQAIMMYSCLFALIASGVQETGGLLQIYNVAKETGRMNFFKAALWSSIPSFVMAFLTTTTGLAMFAVFKSCDPLQQKSGIGLTKADQIVPYYIVSRFIGYPGLVGLCISGILCASLSSLSSALNSLSTVFVEDFINPFLHIPYKTARLKLNACAKALGMKTNTRHSRIPNNRTGFYDFSIHQRLSSSSGFGGMVLGPTLGVYLLGVLTVTTNETGILIGLIFGALFSAWFGLGTSLFGNKYEGLPLSSESCKTLQWNSTEYISPLLEFDEKTGNFSISEEIE
ncbi:putative sodium-dependent multivitamin transporter [Trichonephila inaurata madagascariensis]|uniref:Putative sodium-dependent multivitamin transporter n=1 Tax=Trichonephila inaurata madagascariensis TaxID=2747483 RepID=A0A8X6MI80_9ARAC|nr:putative sodium-dependent multivitamin transporter [Trichonephila inaurata madagascariensis]